MQPALFRSPGLFSGLSLWRVVNAASRSVIDGVAADLLDEGNRREGLRTVVARHVAYEGEAVLPWRGPAGYFPSTQTEVLVQVAADTWEELLLGLRRPHDLFRGVLACDEELIGGKIGDGREAFGFKDGLSVPSEQDVRGVAEIRSGPLAGGSWVLYMRFVQDLEKFSRLRPRDQERVFGISRGDEPLPQPPADAHVPLASQYFQHGRHVFIRRGFPIRQQQEEGLAFVAISSDTGHYRRALDVMLGVGGPPDAVLRYAEAVGGGVYFAPPDAAWLRARRDNVEGR
jgi:Dyp-type peroxidase family